MSVPANTLLLQDRPPQIPSLSVESTRTLSTGMSGKPVALNAVPLFPSA
jgi:hypothetical protein